MSDILRCIPLHTMFTCTLCIRGSITADIPASLIDFYYSVLIANVIHSALLSTLRGICKDVRTLLFICHLVARHHQHGIRSTADPWPHRILCLRFWNLDSPTHKYVPIAHYQNFALMLTWHKVQTGVTQGWYLSPLLFYTITACSMPYVLELILFPPSVSDWFALSPQFPALHLMICAKSTVMLPRTNMQLIDLTCGCNWIQTSGPCRLRSADLVKWKYLQQP